MIRDLSLYPRSHPWPIRHSVLLHERLRRPTLDRLAALAPGPAQLGRGLHGAPAIRGPASAPPLRTQARALSCLHRHRSGPHMPPPHGFFS